MDKRKIIYLHITTWAGISIGARHYYGALIGHDPDYRNEKLRRTLDASEAERLNEEDEDLNYRAGSLYSGFDTQEDVIKFCKKTYKTLFPDATVVLLGTGGCYEPSLCIVGSKKFKAYSRKTVARCEKLGWLDGGHEDEVDEITEAWYKELAKEIA